MLRHVVWGWVLVVCIPAVAAGEELSAPEQAWIRECVERLDAPEERIAEGAADALRRFDARAVGPMVATSADVGSERGWERFEGVLAAFGVRDAADALAAERSAWPAPARGALAEILERLQAADPGPVDPGILERIEAQLAHFRTVSSYSTMPVEPRVQRVVAMGRAAVPALMQILRTKEGPSPGFYYAAAADALTRLVGDEDLPALAALLEDGVLLAARCFKGLSGGAARDALLVPVRRGFMGHELQTALKPHLDDAVTRAALRAHLAEFGGLGGQEVGLVAELLGEAGDDEAAPLLLELVDRLQGLDVRERIATALVRLGEKAGIPVLIEIVAQGDERPPFDVWHCQQAGETLNRVVGRTVFRGDADPFGSSSGNFAKAAKQFRAWWEENRSELVFDPKMRHWRVK